MQHPRCPPPTAADRVCGGLHKTHWHKVSAARRGYTRGTRFAHTNRRRRIDLLRYLLLPRNRETAVRQPNSAKTAKNHTEVERCPRTRSSFTAQRRSPQPMRGTAASARARCCNLGGRRLTLTSRPLATRITPSVLHVDSCSGKYFHEKLHC